MIVLLLERKADGWTLTDRNIKTLLVLIRRGGTITCEVTETRRQSNLEQEGLEIPCDLTIIGPTTLNLRLHYIKLNFDMTIF